MSHAWKAVCLIFLTSNISLIKIPLGLRLPNVNGLCVRGWEEFFQKVQLVNVCLHLFLHLLMVRQWEHLWFIKLILVHIHRGGCLRLFLWSHLFYTVQTYSMLAYTHTQRQTHTHTHTTLQETTDLGHFLHWKSRRGEKKEDCCWYLNRMTKDQSLCNALTHTLSLMRWEYDRKGTTVAWVMETSQCRRHTCQQRPPAPSAALPNTGWRMTYRLPRDSRETRAEKKDSKKRNNCQLWPRAVFITWVQRPVCIF